MRWPWSRPQHRPVARHAWSPPAPIPDHDRVRLPGQAPWRDLLAAEALAESTQPLPLTAPLLSRGARWRTGRSRSC
jgi:hypothetical protein